VIAPERFRHWPLARLEALIRVASLLCALIIIGATLSHVLQLRRAIQSDADARLQTVSRILAKEVNRSLTHTRLLLDQADEALRDVTAARNGELAAVLDGLTRQQSLLREIAIVAPSGRIVASSNRRSVGIDVSGYEGLDLAIDTLGGGPSSVQILTSMALHPTDSDWVEAASILPVAPATSIPDNTANQVLKVPASGKTLFRYIRWKLTPGTSTGAVNITGLARRG
jgi:hypothetical protein